MIRRLSIMFVVGFLIPSFASACPSCYGSAIGPMIDGMNMAIVAMLGITGVVLTAISSFFVMMRRRLKRLRATSPDQPNVNEKGTLQWNNS